MPTDLQIIDGFEALREAYLEANPDAADALTKPASAPAANAPIPAKDVLEAWLKAAHGLGGASGQQRRRLRSLLRQASQAMVSAAAEGVADHETAYSPEPRIETELRDVVGRLKPLLDAQGRIALKGSYSTVAVEAAAWAKLLPGLKGSRAWRFLVDLGRSAVVPTASLRRFLWRVGLVDRELKATARDGLYANDAAQAAARLTGMDPRQLGRLMAWHTESGQGLAGGGRCGAKPDCEGCAFSPGCLWFRYRDGSGTEARPLGASATEAGRLKRRIEEHGAEGLDETELLAMLLGRGGNGQSATGMAAALIHRFGGLRGIDIASSAELRQFKGIGASRARQIKAALELGRRLAVNPLDRGDCLEDSQDVWAAYRDRYRHITQEHFIVLLLDAKNRLIETHLVSKGGLTGSPAHPREVFKEAIRQSASGVILMHNHPSGDPDPSELDIELTNRLGEAGKILGIRVLDHIILGRDSYFSFRDCDLI